MASPLVHKDDGKLGGSSFFDFEGFLANEKIPAPSEMINIAKRYFIGVMRFIIACICIFLKMSTNKNWINLYYQFGF
jgi:hypothetical protein